MTGQTNYVYPNFDFSTEMGRLLHYVYKIPHRGDSVKFYRDLGMKSLRHEEFTEGCEAQVLELVLKSTDGLVRTVHIMESVKTGSEWLC